MKLTWSWYLFRYPILWFVYLMNRRRIFILRRTMRLRSLYIRGRGSDAIVFLWSWRIFVRYNRWILLVVFSRCNRDWYRDRNWFTFYLVRCLYHFSYLLYRIVLLYGHRHMLLLNYHCSWSLHRRFSLCDVLLFFLRDFLIFIIFNIYY
jgi:hypothetical protein